MSAPAPPLFQERILVRGVNWLGDAIMSLPAVERLRQAQPQSELVLLTPHKLAPLWEHSPFVDSVISIFPGETVLTVAKKLRQQPFHRSVLFPNSARAALEAFLGRIPVRIGYPGAGRRWLLTHTVEHTSNFTPMHKRSKAEIKRLTAQPQGKQTAPNPAVHHLYQYLHLTSTLGALPDPLPPRVVVPDADVMGFIETHEARRGLSSEMPLFGMNAGAEYGAAKRWPWERFAATACQVQARLGGRWLIFGGPGDGEIATLIANSMRESLSPGSTPPLNLAGRTSLRELCAGLKACRVVLSNDTGPMHLAAAVGTRVVALFGSTSRALTGPGLPDSREHIVLEACVPCAPCYLPRCPIDHRCMTGFSVTQAVESVLQAAE